MKRDLEQLEESYRKIIPYKTQLADAFYTSFLEANPEYVCLFSGVVWHTQKKMLTEAMAMVVKYARYDEAHLQPAKHFKELGAKHAIFALDETHFDAFITHMLLALEALLGDEWSAELESIWRSALWRVCKLMLTSIRDGQSGINRHVQ